MRHIVWCCLLAVNSSAFTLADAPTAVQLRRPIALVPLGQPVAQLAVLNQRSGTVSMVSLDTGQVISELQVATRISGGCAISANRVLVLDEVQNRLLILSFTDEHQVQLHDQVIVPEKPVNICVSADSRTAVVASTWARQLTVVSLEERAQSLEPFHIDLSFAPRAMAFRSENELVVADAFGGNLALVDLAARQVVRQRELRATHNITAMVLSDGGHTLYLTHQMLNDQQATTAPNVHWGDIMSNVIRTLDLTWFVSDRPEATTADQIYYLGYPDAAAGDPTGLLITGDRRFAVGFAGVNEVAISDRGLNHFARPKVGRRPIAMWLDERANRLYVANHYDDSVSVADVARGRTIDTISLGPMPRLSLADEGELLFYDARLSSDGWYSCHSCHTDGHSNGQRSDTFGDGYRGEPKRVLSLLGSAETRPWAWNGSVPTLEAQIRKSIETTMRGDSPTEAQVQAIAAYLMTLTPPPSITAARNDPPVDPNSLIPRGQQVFTQLGCADCHVPPLYTSSSTYDVGLVDGDDQRKFNPPSLRGLVHQSRLLHDGSATTLKAALQIHPYGEPTELPEDAWSALEAFLHSL